MPTISALRMRPLQGIDEIVDVLVTPDERRDPLQARAVVRVSPDAAKGFLLFFRALDFPLLAARAQRAFAHKDNDSVGPLDASANAVFPILVLGFLDGHVDEL